MYDLLIRGGMVLDGSGADGVRADVGVIGGKIAALGALPEAQAQTVVDARGKTVTPGFIDIHRHGDLAAFRPGFGALELQQGLTTVINGNCGLSAAPFGRENRQQILEYIKPIVGQAQDDLPTESMAGYLAALEKTPSPLNQGMLVRAGVLRADAAGYGIQRLETAHYRRLHGAMERALADGAWGVSLGLGYAPECFYTTQELIRALEPLRNGSIPVTVHMREEGSAVDEAVEEMITVARALHCPVHISHLKAMGKGNWQKKIPQVLRRLEQVRQEGLELSWDVYPYTAGSTQLLHIMPPDLLQGGTEEVCRRLMDPKARECLSRRLKTGTDFDNISLLVGWDNIIMSTLNRPENQQYAGKSVAQIAALRQQEPDACVFDLLAEERCTITMIDFITCEQDIAGILQSDAANVISDSTYPTQGRPHPRLYGTFARVLEKYVRQERVLTLPQAVAKMSALPAQALGLPGKGRLAVGYDADINVFDPAQIRENATYDAPARPASGMDYTFVNGTAAIWQGALTGRVAGRILRRE